MRKILPRPLIDPSMKITEEVHDEYCLCRKASQTYTNCCPEKQTTRTISIPGSWPQTQDSHKPSQHQGYEQNPKAPRNPAQPRCDFSSNPADGLESYQGLLPNILQVQNPKDRSHFHTAALFPSSLVYHLFRFQNWRSLDLEEIYYIRVYCGNIFKIKTWGILISARK